jgi:putative transposase
LRGETPVTTGEIARACGITPHAVRKRARRDAWHELDRIGQQRETRYLYRDLPEDIRIKLTAVHSSSSPAYSEEARRRVQVAQQYFTQASDAQRAVAIERAGALRDIERRAHAGQGVGTARAVVAAERTTAGARGFSVRTLERWASDVAGFASSDWAVFLLPHYHLRGRSRMELDVSSADYARSLYLDPVRRSKADVIRRTQADANARGVRLPSSRTLERHLAEIDWRVTTLMREGKEALASRLPHASRDVAGLHAGEEVNGDGLKFDYLHVRFPDGDIVNAATGWFWQDVRTRKFLAWELDKTENSDLIRLATRALVEVCAPRVVMLDNTRAANNKQMGSRSGKQYRGKSRDTDGFGMFGMLGIEVRRAKPDKVASNPGVKPIERQFGIGGIHDGVRWHELLEGKGRTASNPVELELLKSVIALVVAETNARTGRRSPALAGASSFDQAWERDISLAPIRVLTKEQRALLDMRFEVVKVSGMVVTLAAGKSVHGKNRYVSERLAALDGERVQVFFNPDNLAEGAHVYDLDGRYLCPADHLSARAYNDTKGGREEHKLRQRVVKDTVKKAESERRLSAQQMAARYHSAVNPSPTGPSPKVASRADRKGNEVVIEGNFKRVPHPARDSAEAAQRSREAVRERVAERTLRLQGNARKLRAE